MKKKTCFVALLLVYRQDVLPQVCQKFSNLHPQSYWQPLKMRPEATSSG